MNVFDSQSTSMGHAKDTHIRKSISDHEDETKKMRVVPTRRRSSRMFQPPGETDFLTEYKGASGMFYAKSRNTSSQYQFLESSKNGENDTTANFPTDGNDDSRSPTATRKENAPCSCPQDHDESRDARNPLLSKALHELDQSLIAGDRQRMAQAWNSLGLVRLHTQLKPHEAIRCHRNALQLLLSSPSSPITSTEEDSSSSSGACQGACSSQHLLELATTYNDLGLCYERLNDTNEAMTMYLEAQKILSTEKLLVETHPQILALKRAIDRIQRIL